MAASEEDKASKSEEGGAALEDITFASLVTGNPMQYYTLNYSSGGPDRESRMFSVKRARL